MDEQTAELLDALWEIIRAYGLCQSCGFAPVKDEWQSLVRWTCPRCGFVSTNDPDTSGPVSRTADPVGAEDPVYGEAPVPDDDEDADLTEFLEPDFPLLDQISG